MTQYILKSAVVAEINRIKNTEYNGIFINDDVACCALDMTIDAINALEVKETDLEKEINNFGLHYDGIVLDRKELIEFAKHFFELGLKAQKGE